MADPLEHYRNKRDFTRTREPRGARSRRSTALRFVVQKHAARRLHYDFRLELDGTLKSWAVPKGPSLDPARRRMSVHVEDHPLEYGSFEGEIPAGEYGAGHVIVWDQGIWIPQGDPRDGYREGKLKFELRGEKLSGGWTLVRMKPREGERQESWLLIKEKDEAARPESEYDVLAARPGSVLNDAQAVEKPAAAKPRTKGNVIRTHRGAARRSPLPETLAPQLATLATSAPQDPGWLCEIKFDGYRLLARIEDDKVRLVSRNGNDWTRKLAALATDVRHLELEWGWIDGELVSLDRRGIPDFQALQNALGEGRTEDLLYYVFDAPFLDGEDRRSMPLEERRRLLGEKLSGKTPGRVRFSESFARTPVDLLRSACELGSEGVIVKRADAAYVSGRSMSWLKLKCTERQEFVIGGFTDPEGARKGLGSLLLGLREPAGQLRYAGRVGTGFTEKSLTDLRARLDRLAQAKSPFAALPAGVRGHWVRPVLVAEVSFAQWTRSRVVRQAVFHGLRADKPASEVGDEPRVSPARTGGAAHTRAKKLNAPAAREPGPARGGSDIARTAVHRSIEVTHAERVIDASTGITKGELADYYAHAAELLLADIGGRPVSLLRAPGGIGRAMFFQKHAAESSIPGIRTLDPALDPEHEPYLQVPGFTALAGCVQMNVVEFHAWNALAKRIDRPDRIVFDLDPGEGLAWRRMQEGALLVQTLLRELDLECTLKTSGGKGLHVTVPFAPKHEWAPVSAFAKAVVAHLARVMPDRFVLKSGPRNRVGKIFVDYLRNTQGATTVAAWSVRARPGMGVSVPVQWDEIDDLRGGSHWTVRDVQPRVDEAMAAATKAADTRSAQSLSGAARALEVPGFR